MFLIIGLGNPGKKFQKTRHNLGFRIIDEFAKRNNFPEFKLAKKFSSLISKDVFNNQKIILVKPQTSMNNSGKAVKLLTKSYKLEPNNLIVIHDDIDLPLEKIKIAKNRGSAGHKGVESIIKELGTENFIRFRIGIQPSKKIRLDTCEFILQKFNKNEREILKEVIEKIVEAIETSIKDGMEKAMNKFNK